jgi:hypothetical protein
MLLTHLFENKHMTEADIASVNWNTDSKQDKLNEFAPGAGGDDEAGDDPYKYPKPERYRRSADYFGQFEADHFDREDFDDATGEFKGYWGDKQIAYFKFDNPIKTSSDDSGRGWYYEPQSDSSGNNTSAAPAVDRSDERKQQELSMIRAFLKSGNRPSPGSQIYNLMKRHGVTEGQDNPYGYRKGQTVKLNNGTQGRVIDIFDDSIEVLLVGGRTVTVDFRDAQVIDEQGVAEATGDEKFDNMMGKISSSPEIKQAQQQRKLSTIQRIADAVCNDQKCDYDDLTDQDLEFIADQADTSIYDVMIALGRQKFNPKRDIGKWDIDEQGVAEDSEDTVSFREMVDVVDKHYPKYYAELSGSNISDKQFEQKITSAYKKIMQKQGVAEGSPELLKKEMPLHRHAEKLLAQNGVSKDDPDYHHHLGNTIKHLRQFGNIDLINKSDKQGVAEDSENAFAPVKLHDQQSNAYGDAILDIADQFEDKFADEKASEYATAIATVGHAFLNNGMRSGRAKLFGLEQAVYKHVLMALDQQGLNIVKDLIRPHFNPDGRIPFNKMAEGDISQLEKDVADAPVEPIANMEAKEKVGNMDADAFDAAMARLKKLAGAGPMKTVWDPAKRVYKNVPTAVQPKK